MISPKAIDESLTHSSADAHKSDIVFLPIRMDGPIGIYTEQAIDLMKDLKGQGVDASWSTAKESRGWYGERTGIVELVVIPLVVGVASSAAWDALKKVVRMRKNSTFKIKAYTRTHADGSRDAYIEVEGTGSDIASSLERLDPWRELKSGINSDE
ncbi:hypothetical protein [Micromonospora rubida]